MRQIKRKSKSHLRSSWSQITECLRIKTNKIATEYLIENWKFLYIEHITLLHELFEIHSGIEIEKCITCFFKMMKLIMYHI